MAQEPGKAIDLSRVSVKPGMGGRRGSSQGKEKEKEASFFTIISLSGRPIEYHHLDGSCALGKSWRFQASSHADAIEWLGNGLAVTSSNKPQG